MILANVTFGARRQNEPDPLEDAAESYLSSLFHSGQLCGERFLTWTNGLLNAHVLLAGPGAWELRYHSRYGKKELETVTKVFGRKPAWRTLGDNARERPSSWKGAPFLYLFTHAFDWASPVCRGDGKPPIPVFMLPVPYKKRDGLYFWQRSYCQHDHIWLGCGALEIGAYRQLADPDSELAEHGRELCREIEAATGVPMFYYLMRYWGRARGEAERPCPGCGARWKITDAKQEPACLWHFDFKCDRCRLLSHLGVATDGGRHTRIGEFQHKEGKGNQTGPRTGLSSLPYRLGGTTGGKSPR
jgi:predicted  nucleic acid-binding Zn ribbon protein